MTQPIAINQVGRGAVSPLSTLYGWVKRPASVGALLLCCAVMLTARVGSAVTLRCADVPKVAASGYCAGLEAAACASTSDPIVQKALTGWRRVGGPVRALTGRETAVVVLARDALVQGSSPAPAAYLCPSAPPTICAAAIGSSRAECLAP